jgi:hypothetical protein
MDAATFNQFLKSGDIMSMAFVFYSENNQKREFEFDKTDFEHYFNNWMTSSGVPLQMCYQIIIQQIKNKLK